MSYPLARGREQGDGVVKRGPRNFRRGVSPLSALRQSWRRPVAVLAALSILLLLFMPMAPARAAPSPHHHGMHHGHQHEPVKAPPCADHHHGACPFCVAHSGFSLLPPLHPVLHRLALNSKGMVERAARIETPFQALRSRHRSRAPPLPVLL